MLARVSDVIGFTVNAIPERISSIAMFHSNIVKYCTFHECVPMCVPVVVICGKCKIKPTVCFNLLFMILHLL